MGLDKKGFYTLRDIDAVEAPWNVIYGERAPGKSFACKYRALQEAYQTEGGKKFCLIRRHDVDIKIAQVEAYFMDNDVNCVAMATDNEWEFVTVYKSKLYFGRTVFTDDEGHFETERSPYYIGEYFAINAAKHVKSTGHPGLKTALVEEFITDEGYLRDEPGKLMHLLSTLFRKDDDVKVYLIGNTLSRVCPYFAEWGLTRLKKQKVGTIDTYIMETDAGPVKLACEYCPPSPHKSKLFFGRTAKSIQGGAWQTGIFPQLEGDLKKDYDEVYKLCYISVDNFKFNLTLLVHKKEGYIVTYVYPASENRSLPDRVLTGAYSTDFQWTPQLNADNPAELKIAECFTINKVVYADNQTGQDFKDSIKAEITNPLSTYHPTL